jgi:hypothetical protein
MNEPKQDELKVSGEVDRTARGEVHRAEVEAIAA